MAKAEGLEKTYPRVRALDALTLELPEGAVGLLGPNGAGKSTFIKILLGLAHPTAGTVSVLGHDPRRAPLAVRQRIGYMPETESFLPGLHAVDTVYLAARLSGLPHTDAMQRAHRVLNYVGVHEERYRNVETYSTGMKQKVKLAQAIVHHPELLLLDEPTTGLDPRAREEMLELVRDLAHGKGMSVVLSTHILHDVEVVCDRVVILHHGRLLQEGEIGEMTAPGRDYEVRVRGDREAFTRLLTDAGIAWEEAGADLRVTLDNGTDRLLRAAADSGVQVRRLVRSRGTLEDLFSRIVTER